MRVLEHNSNAHLQGPILQEKANGRQRVDGGPTRPQSRLGSVQGFGRSTNQPLTNAAKPAKRAWEEESQPRPTASTAQSASQMAETKRRKTEDEHNPPLVRTVTAPPIRGSTATRKVSKPSDTSMGKTDILQFPGITQSSDVCPRLSTCTPTCGTSSGCCFSP